MAFSFTKKAQMPQMMSRAKRSGSMTLEIFSTMLVMPKYRSTETNRRRIMAQTMGSTVEEVKLSK